MKPVHRAIVFLQQARDILDEEANHTTFADRDRLYTIETAAGDIGGVLLDLEHLDGAP